MTQKRRLVVAGIFGFGVAVGGASFWAAHARAEGIPSPSPLTYTGLLEDDNGVPVTGNKEIVVALYDDAVTGNKVCATTKTIPLVGGRFSIPLDDACNAAVSANPNLWVELTTDGSSLGRTKVGAVPFAVEAAHAVKATKADNATAGLHSPRLNANPSCPGVGPDYDCTVCDPGEVVVSAGAFASNNWHVAASYPTGATTWHFKCLAADGAGQACAGFRAMCAKVSP